LTLQTATTAAPTSASRAILIAVTLFGGATRPWRRLLAARASIAVGKIAGAVGTYANVSPTVEAEALAALGLRPETVATQVVQRDRHAELFGALHEFNQMMIVKRVQWDGNSRAQHYEILMSPSARRKARAPTLMGRTGPDGAFRCEATPDLETAK